MWVQMVWCRTWQVGSLRRWMRPIADWISVMRLLVPDHS